MNDSWDDIEIQFARNVDKMNGKQSYTSNPFLSSNENSGLNQSSIHNLSNSFSSRKETRTADLENHVSTIPNDVNMNALHDNISMPNTNRRQPMAASHDFGIFTDHEFIGTSYGSSERLTRVFGSNYKYMKSFIKQKRNSLTNLADITKEEEVETRHRNSPFKRQNSYEIVERHGTPELPQQHFSTVAGNVDKDMPFEEKFLNMNQDYKSVYRQLRKLKEVNELALKRKDELQREVLQALKRVSELEVANNHSTLQYRELNVELRVAKERVAEAEREAASAIGRTSKLEKELHEANMKKQRYFDEIRNTGIKVKELEDELLQTKTEVLFLNEKKTEHNEKVSTFSDEIEKVKGENDALRNLISSLDEKNNALSKEVDRLQTKNSNYANEKGRLAKNIQDLEEENQRMHNHCKLLDKTSSQLKEHLHEQKNKFEIMIRSRLNLEKEMKELHQELTAQKNEKQKYLNAYKDITEKLMAYKKNISAYRLQNEKLSKENKELKDKISISSRNENFEKKLLSDILNSSSEFGSRLAQHKEIQSEDKVRSPSEEFQFKEGDNKFEDSNDLTQERKRTPKVINENLRTKPPSPNHMPASPKSAYGFVATRPPSNTYFKKKDNDLSPNLSTLSRKLIHSRQVPSPRQPGSPSRVTSPRGMDNFSDFFLQDDQNVATAFL